MRATPQSAPVPVLLLSPKRRHWHAFNGEIGMGKAVRIFIGAPVPDTADTVIMQEKTGRFDNITVEISESVAIYKNIRPAGDDFKKGDTSPA